MKRLVLRNKEESYTYLRSVFYVIENNQLKYNWLITDCECYFCNKYIDELFSQKYTWISGKDLTDIISKENSQFIWGVFLGFVPEITLNNVLKYNLPKSEDYEGVLDGDVITKHPLSEIEIIAWDSSLTLLLSKHDDLITKFKTVDKFM